MKTITVEDLPRWHVLHDGLAVPRGLSPHDREQPLRVIEYHVRVSHLDNELPACGYSAAVLAARALVHTASWPSVAFALRAAHNPDLFRQVAGGPSVEASEVAGRLKNALWACGQADAFARDLRRRVRPWLEVLELAHCVGALESAL
jgi:hypothetical protein|nr:MAG TPA: hypothetical protein [Caudoviricetes sp.]